MVKVDNTAVAVWARHSPARMYCAVVSVDDSSARTACSGAWNVGDADVELHDDPPAAERCIACKRAIAAERFVVFAQAAPPFPTSVLATSDPEPLFDAVMPDDRFDDGGEA